MKSQIYVHAHIRKYLKSQIDEFAWVFFNKLIPNFNRIEEESEEIQNEYFNECMASTNFGPDFDDPSVFVEDALDYGIKHYEMLSLAKYNLTATWHATLYQIFEQQLRKFLYKEAKQCSKIEFQTFCIKMQEIKKFFEEHNLELEKLESWAKIHELYLLCNVIKHGDGESARNLRKLNCDLFLSPTFSDYPHYKGKDSLELSQTTLLDKTLNINEDTFKEYVGGLKNFWDELPERCWGKDI